MNEKRFEFYSDDMVIGVLDTVTGRTFNSFEIVDKLNEQQDTIGEQKIAIDELITDYKKLEKENEKLKSENKKLEQQYHNLVNAIVKTCNDLGKENIYLGDFDICKRITEYEKELFDDD